MTEWADDCVVFGAKPFGETKSLLEVFAATQGRSAGMVHGGASRRLQPVLQAGNLVRVTWKARLNEQLGFFSQVELVEPYAARALQDGAALAGLTCAVAIVRKATAERQPAPILYEALVILLEAFATPELWPPLYVRFEIGALAAAGYGLDLSHCALTGAVDDLAYVSPKSGRAASRQAGAPFADKLLALPAFLSNPRAPIAAGDVADGFALAGHFLESRIFDRQGEGMPPSRTRLIEALGRSGRL
jgi:DNA repair protein RecO (recombination protein O)